MLIVRYYFRGLWIKGRQARASANPERFLLFSANGDRLFAFFGVRQHGWKNSAKGFHAKKALAARVTSVCGYLKEALQEQHVSSFHSIAGNNIQIEVSAARAMSEMRKGNRHAPGVEAFVAGMTTPWPAAKQSKNEVHSAGPMGSETIRTTTLGTNHTTGLSKRRLEYRKAMPVGKIVSTGCLHRPV